jgi:hypothetical protein
MVAPAIAPLRGSTGATRGRGRPIAENTAADWRDDALALLAERADIGRKAGKLIPFARYCQQSASDLIAEQSAAGIVVFLEHLRGPKDAA